MEILLYTRRGCHLCEEAEDIVAALEPRARLVEVGGDERLERAWGTRVPVLVIDGRVAAEGRFDEAAVTAVLVALRARD